ncbi:hypothetical protein GCM10010965_14990 [Caldalkalibacillus thermarum]|uniref:TadE/TadG family type IV pilus assembly protein n=1 Tax=Caldalkalibacillus thermarum TaxID=296745 RepID=UPI0016663C93|nr:hypothetical protein [Caldalkalibacillus thermarum]GGK23137.1 hypothetical protein GCM10010965_14990 [Caldalkalibacillus thermarum]
MLRRLATILKNERGDFVQYALAVPVVFGLIFGGIIGYQLYNAHQVVSEAAWHGARVAASSHSANQAVKEAAKIVEAHLPTDTVTSYGEQSNVPSGYVTGVLTKQGGYFYLSSLGLQPLIPADGTMEQRLNALVNKTVAVKVDQIREQPDIDHNRTVDGRKEGQSSQGGTGEPVTGIIKDARND